MRQEALATLNRKTVTTMTALTQLMRLHQITCGHFAADDGSIQEVKNNRLAELLDVLDEIEEIKVCVGYEVEKKKYNYLPFDENLHDKLKPIYETIPGWRTSTFGLTGWNQLPKKAQDYIDFLE